MSYFSLLISTLIKRSFLAFRAFILMGQLKDWTGNGEEKEGMTSSKGPQGGIEPSARAARTQPLAWLPALPTEPPGHF